MKLINRSYVFANVKDTTYVNYGDFYIPIPTLPETTKYMTTRLFIKKVILPYDWKRVDSTNNQITIVNLQNNTTANYYLTEGNPNVIDLVDELNTLQTDFTVSFNRITSRLSFHNTKGHGHTLSTTANELLGIPAGPHTVNGNETYIAPNPVDVRPYPIVEFRIDVNTAGQEVFNKQVNNTGILCAVAMNVPLYGHKVWVDDAGLYWCDITNINKDLHIKITNPDGIAIIPQTSPYFVLGFDTYIDEEAQLLEVQREALKLQQYSMVLNHAPKEDINLPPELAAPIGESTYQLSTLDLGEQI